MVMVICVACYIVTATCLRPLRDEDVPRSILGLVALVGLFVTATYAAMRLMR